MVETFACSFRATEIEARRGIVLVVQRLKDMGIADTRVDEVQIALAEAVNNVVEHAYAETATGDVLIRCNLHSDRLWVEIRDAGTPFPDAKLPEGKPALVDPSTPLEDLPEGGFGWFLIRELASDIQYQRNPDNNQLSLCFEIQLTQ
ncbi:ATP-binding protein [Rhodobacteraceae bacterium R_SAG7]|jgi:serine/threonine-protein kinase RsbW|uniref:ATP-binding protein n=1 Tax=Rhodobacterales TaxID=204455 RepID=UPI0000462D90|nr:ATP-binding protein [Ruegeria sp. TM1040]ABF62798.1 putative anti-sigma regulatory factor serine/threonine protein kinase [Ruegeria sp. TM1040]MDF9304332.1 ATP-binding protein [Tritonibacter mobilis]NKW78012.1 ATP-binding protein [Rhodobacteraceae bacterium R_SAG7]